MKSLFLAFISIAFFSLLSPALAQGTAFNYQGQLSANGNKANGSYDMAFSLYTTNVTGVVIAGPLTNSATIVSNGLFNVTLDFGPGVFTGSNLWLDISVSPAGSNTFSELTPRQHIMPTPYAIYSAKAATATTAASVSASNISGTVSAAQLSATVLTNGANSVNLAGTFSGNGSGLTGINGAIPWQIVSGTNVQAASNTGYMLTNNSPVTVTLPSSPNVGDIVRISCPGLGGWTAVKNAGQSILNNFDSQFNWTSPTGSINEVALSADGTKVVAPFGYGILTSTNSGATWTLQAGAPSESWVGVASSADGTKLVAVADPGGIYTSTNSGLTWVDETNAPNLSWISIASSADGTKLAAIGCQGLVGESVSDLYTSTNSGGTWMEQTNAPAEFWVSIVSSTDGTKLAAIYNDGDTGGSGGGIYTSANSGVTWVDESNAPNISWASIASSADGTRLAAIGGSEIYTSKDSGVTWGSASLPPGPTYWTCIASSADGAKLVAGGGFSQLDTSSDGGISWAVQQNSYNFSAGNWDFVASSADGTILFALTGPAQGSLYIRTIATDNLTGEPNSAVELQYVGNGQFLPISYTGSIAGF